MGSISSGYTSMLQSSAIACDRSRILARLQNNSPCLPGAKSTGWAPASSVLEEEAAIGCGSGEYFKKATTSGAYTLSVQERVGATCGNSLNSNCGKYVRSFRPPCPVQTPKNPLVISVSQCQPSRFF